MKSNALTMSAFVLALAASTGAFAASQGTAGATSTGTYTNTLGATATPQVRVFGLQDSTLTSATAATTANPFNTSMPTVTDQFCVAHSSGGNVRITFSSPGMTGATGNNIFATDATTGATAAYVQFAYQTGTTVTSLNSVLTTALRSIDISSAQTDLVNCVTPNVTKGIVLQNGANWPANKTGVFTDVMTVTASPI